MIFEDYTQTHLHTCTINIDSEREIKKLKKELDKSKKTNKKNIYLILSISAIFLVSFYAEEHLFINYDKQVTKRNGFLIEPLKANLIETNYPLQLEKNDTITVNIENPGITSQYKIAVIKDAILSKDLVQKDGTPAHKNLQYEVYYKGWAGALAQTYSNTPSFDMPKKINLIEVANDQDDILIKLTKEKNAEGYLGYTKLTLNNDHALKATITVFDIDNLSDNDLSTIIRHEFGHALGLGHSTDKSDLMHDTIDTKYGYITNCDVQALSKLYDGQESSEIICKASY